MNRLAGCFVVLVFFLLSSAGSLFAQDADDVQQGIKAYGTYRGGEIDSISMTNGNLIVDIPLVSYPQRGKVHLGYKLIYNGKNYKQRTVCQADICTTYVTRISVGSPLVAVADQGFTTKQTSVQYEGTQLQVVWSSLVATDGASHILAAFSSTGNGENETVDGTGLHYYNPVSGTSFATDTNGTRFGGSVSQEDTNGNQISTVDTVGRSISNPPLSFGSGGSGTCPSGPLPIHKTAQWVVPGPDGPSTFVFCWAQVNVVAQYDVDDGTQTYTNINFLQSLVLPNGTAWTFQYSNDGFGDLTQITFPTGGTISYVWADGASCTGMLVPPRWVASRTANDGTGGHTWTYTYGANTTVADPLGNHTVYTNSYLSYCSAYTTQVQYYNGAVQSSNLIKAVSTTYSKTASPFSRYLGTDFMNIVPIQITTTWYVNGQPGNTSQVTKSYDSGFTFPSPRPNDNTQYTGLYGKVIVQNESDYGTNGQPGLLVRQTKTSYAWQSPNPHYSNYLTNNMLDLVYSTEVTDGTSRKAYTQYGYDEFSPLVTSGMGSGQDLDLNPWTAPYRGNQTSVNRWRNLPTVATLSSTTTYYDTGMPSVAKDPLLNPTTYFYSSTFQDAYVTQVQNALTQNINYDYDPNTGLKTSATDLNSQTTTYSYDSSWRLTNVLRPTGGGQTSFCHTDLNPSNCPQGTAPYQVIITKEITSAQNEIATAVVDGLGRLAHTQLNSDLEGVDFVDDAYDAAGNKASTTNPYRTTSDSTYGVTTSVYDVLHRVKHVTQPDGSPLNTAYCANTTLVTDEAGHWRRSTVDALGRLIKVDEPNSPTATVNPNGCPGSGEPIWVTTYSYDTLGNLLGVVQAGSRQRNFSYDSLSRILSSNNPESGTLLYTYDSDGNVTTKVTPLQNHSSGTATLSYCYDPLNRMLSKAYTNQSCPQTTPVATYSYDGPACLGAPGGCYNIGHRTGMTDPAGSESWAYDRMGRTEVQSRTTNSKTKTTSFLYNLDSSLATLTYPSTRVVTYTPDTAGRPSNVMDNTTSVYYATGTCPNGVSGNGACYAPPGEVALLQNGSSLFSTHIYNKRLQPCWMYATTGTALAWNTTLCSSSETTAGNMLDLKYNYNLGSDNGSLVSTTNNRVSDRSQTFTYDQLNRISTAQTTATHSSDPAVCWGQAFGYDASGDWSNLLSIAGVSSAYTGCTQQSLSITVNANNQIVGDTYDAAGNLWIVPNPAATYLYNTENQLCKLGGSDCTNPAYIYDGDGNRVEKTGSKIYWYSGSEVLDETDMTGSVTNGSFNEYVFFGGNRIARRDSSGNVFYYLTDQIGSSRVIAQVLSGQTTATMCYDGEFEPFGGEHAYLNSCPQNYKFTGKERDTESNLDNFGARYYASMTGRFMSPDWALKPVTVPYANFGDPQTLNLYTYVENSPLNRIDADGHAYMEALANVAGRECPECIQGEELNSQVADKKDQDKDKKAQNKSQKPGFWQRLRQRLVNGFTGHGFKTNEQLTPVVTHKISFTPNFYSATVSVAVRSDSLTYVPSSDRLYYSPGVATGMGASLTAGTASDPNGFASGPSVSGCYFAGAGGCAGVSSSGDTAVQVGVGVGGWGAGAGYGVDPADILKRMVESIPNDPTVPKGVVVTGVTTADFGMPQ